MKNRSSLHLLILLSFCLFLYTRVCYKVFKLFANNVVLDEKMLLWALIESLFFRLDCYTPEYEKDTKQTQNRPMETTIVDVKKLIII